VSLGTARSFAEGLGEELTAPIQALQERIDVHVLIRSRPAGGAGAGFTRHDDLAGNVLGAAGA